MRNLSAGDDVGVEAVTLEVLARGFYRESLSYGFGLPDYIQFVNLLLEAAMTSETDAGIAGSASTFTPRAEAAGDAAAAPGDGGSAAAAFGSAQLPLVGERVMIRAAGRNDRQRLERWVADPEGRHFLLCPLTAEQLAPSELLTDPKHVAGIICLPDGSPVGCVAFLNVNVQQGKAELRKLIGEREMRGRGLAKDATRIWIQYGRAGLGLRKICLHTLGSHIRNLRLNEDLGFKVEGILRNEVVVDGRAHDVLRMGLTFT